MIAGRMKFISEDARFAHNPMKTPKFLIVFSFVALVAVASGFWLYRKTTSNFASVSAKEVVVGYLPIYVDLPVFVASEKGFFKNRGLKVRLESFKSSPAMGDSMVKGDVDAGASIAYAVALGIESRDPGKLKVFLVDSESPTGYLSSLVALKSSGIKTVADLRGKTVASFPGPAALTFGKMVLEKFGLNPNKDLKFFELDAAAHLDALRSGQVDALFTYEPIATQAVLDYGAVKILPAAVESQIINPWQAGVWVLSSDFITRRPEDARALSLAIYDAVDFLRLHPVEAKAALEKYTQIRSEVALQTPNVPFAKLGEVDLPAFQRHADILRDRGVISKSIDAKQMLIPQAWLRQ